MRNHTTITKTIASATLALALVGGVSGTAGAQTREHILLARQVGVPATSTQSTDGEPCADWTNEDGTHGTNCPSGGGGGGRKLHWDYIRANS